MGTADLVLSLLWFNLVDNRLEVNTFGIEVRSTASFEHPSDRT